MKKYKVELILKVKPDICGNYPPRQCVRDDIKEIEDVGEAYKVSKIRISQVR